MQPSLAPQESTEAVIAHGTVSRAHWIVLAWAVVVVGIGLLAVGWFGGAGPSLDEKRVLATRPALPESWPALRAFPGAFDDYVHDQFPPRAQLIAGLNFLRYRMGWSGFSRVIVGRDGWLFYDNDTHLAYPAASAPLSTDDVDMWVEVYAARKQWLAARGIAYQVLMVPTKESTYPDKLPAWAQRARERDWTADQNLFRTRFPKSEFIDLRPIFAQAIARGNRLFSTLDTHWNGVGAHLGYVALLDRLNRLQPRFPSLQPAPLGAFPHDRHSLETHDLAVMLGIAFLRNAGFMEFDSPPPPAPASIQYLNKNASWTSPRVVTTGHPGPRLLMTMDSFSNALLPFLYPHFSQIVLSHNQDGSFRRDLIERFHPDIVVLEVVETGARFSMGMQQDDFVQDANTLLQLTRIDGPQPPRGDDLQCNIERAVPVAGSRDPQLLELSGWVAQVSHQRVAPEARIVLHSAQGNFATTVAVDIVRPDLPRYFHRSGIALSGFAARVSLAGVPAGDYTVSVQQDYPDGNVQCAQSAALELK